jgi:WD40 repeat protein/serine/threonine protein kinase
MTMEDPRAACARCGARLADHSPLAELCPRCLMELALGAGTDAPDATIGPYRLIEKLGEGGMGIVWLARQEHPIRREVALKVVKPGTDSAQVLSRFDTERQALAILSHPNIATVYDAGLTDDGRPYFAMEYVPGSPITTFADLRELPIAARLELFLQLCDAVEHAHQKGVLHRDLKPANILVQDRDGRPVVKVIDFGVAKALGPALSLERTATQIGSLVGTPEYMSPEQAGLTESGVDTRTDIYSLGLVLYELLVGALPFDAGELRRKALLEVLRVIREDEPPRLASRLTSQTDAEIKEIAKRRLTEPRALVRQLRGDLEWITNRALEKEPMRRYASASELGADVRRHLSSEPVSAGPPDVRYRLGKLIRRHRAGAIAAGVALTALVVGAVMSAAMWVRAERARIETRRQLAASLVASGVARMDAWDWTGGLLSFAKALEIEPDRARQREHRLRIAQVTQRMPRLVRFWPHGIRVTSLDVSPEGVVASAGTDGTVRLWSLRSARQIGAALRHEDAVNRVAFSPDGRLLASASEDGTARVWRTADGAPIGPPIRHQRGVRDVAFSPDSQVVATAGADGWVRLQRVSGNAPHIEIDLGAPLLRVIFTKDGSRFAAAASAHDGRPFAIRLWSTADGAPAGEWIRGEPTWLLLDADLSPDGLYVVTAHSQGCMCARLWSTVTGKPVGNPLMHRNAVPTARFNAAGTLVVTGGYDRVVQVWKVPTTDPSAPPWTIAGWPEAVRFTADGQLVAATVNGAVEIVAPGSSAARENSRLFPTFAHAGPVSSAMLDVSGRFLATGSGDGAVRVWDLTPSLISEPTFAWYASPWANTVLFSGGGRFVASAARIFDTTSGAPVAPPLRAEPSDLFIALSSDGRRVATAGPRIARVWDVETGEPLSPQLSPRGNMAVLQALVFSPDGRRLLTLSNANGTGEATVWDVESGARAATLPHQAYVTAGAFSADGTLLMTTTAAREKNLHLWRIDRSAEVASGRHPEGVYFAIFDSPRNRILTVGFDQRVLEWAVGSSLTSTQVLELHSEPSWLATSRNGTIVAGGRGGDLRVRVSRSDGPAIANMYQTGAVLSSDTSPDGEHILTSGDDGRVNLWNLRRGERLSPAYRLGGPIENVKFAPDGRSFAMTASGVYLQPLVPDDRPATVLNDEAELLGARRLVDANEAPLRLEDLAARWNRISAAGPDDIERAPASWYRRQASIALFRGNPALALDHLASLRSAGRLAWTDTMLSLAALGKAGRWVEAAGEVQRLGAVRNVAPELVFVEAVARRRAGETQAALTICRDLLSGHAATRNPDRALWILRVCLLDPEATTGPGARATAQLVEQVIDLRAFGTRESLTGALEMRAGRFPEAIARLQRAVAAGEATPHTTLFLALALARTQKLADARKWLLASETFAWPPANLFSQMAFREAWFEAEAVILREEVRRALDER